MGTVEAGQVPGVEWIGDRALVSTGGTKDAPVEPRRNEPKPLTPEQRANAVKYRANRPSSEQVVAAARAAFQANQAQQARKDQQERQQAKKDFDSFKRKYGANFDQKAQEEYDSVYATEGFRLTRPTPYGEEMARLLRRHLGLEQ